jgi:hypothetical protein
MNKDARHLGLINRINEKTGASVGMYRGVLAFPIEWGQFFKVSDDKKPMTGTWYRNTIQPWMLGKVTEVDGNMITVTATGGVIDTCTVGEFADSWELS